MPTQFEDESLILRRDKGMSKRQSKDSRANKTFQIILCTQ
nr:MAG TPA: hypothetical protein [Caudoviricetes sp.]